MRLGRSIMNRKYKDMTVGEGLITALQQAVDYEKGTTTEEVKQGKSRLLPFLILSHKLGQRLFNIRLPIHKNVWYPHQS